MNDIDYLTNPSQKKEIEDVVINPEDVPEVDSKYRLILLVAQRAKQIQRGARPRVDMNPQTVKATKIARAEFDENKVLFVSR